MLLEKTRAGGSHTGTTKLNLTNWDLSDCFTPHQSLPLMREVDSPQGEDGGRDNYPSVKNQRFLTAPLTRGAFGRSRASISIRQIGICLSALQEIISAYVIISFYIL